MNEPCHLCDGTGEVEVTRDCTPSEDTGGMSELSGFVLCEHCNGTGDEPEPARISEARER